MWLTARRGNVHVDEHGNGSRDCPKPLMPCGSERLLESRIVFIKYQSTFAALFEQHGVALSLEDAGRILGYPSRNAARLSSLRGTFPVPTRSYSGKTIVSTADLAAFLVGEELVVPPAKRRRGQPTKVEQLRRRQSLTEHV